MRNFTSLFALPAVLVFAASGLAVAQDHDHNHEAPEVGSTPPEISDVEGWINAPKANRRDEGPAWDRQGQGGVDFEQLRGKVVVIEFWATWCPPCKRSIPHLNGLWEELHDDLVVLSFTAVDGRQSKREIRSFVKDQIQYPVGVLSGGHTFARYGVTGIPHAVVVGRDGRIRWAGNPLSDEFESAVRDAAGERQASRPTSRPGR